MMKSTLLWLALLIVLLQPLGSGEQLSLDHNTYEWEFRPETDGSAHVKVKIMLGPTYWGGFSFTCSKDAPIENMKAWEAGTNKPIGIRRVERGNDVLYELELGTVGTGFQFFVEYDGLNAVDEDIDEVYSFGYGWTSWCKAVHKATVVLPQGHELLYTEHTAPEGTTTQRGSVIVAYSTTTAENETFEIEVTFSRRGVELLKEADTNFSRKKYEEAKDAYLKAIAFYSQFKNLYNRDLSDFLEELGAHVAECDQKIKEETEKVRKSAEEKFQSATEALSAKDYARAIELFREARDLYYSLSDYKKGSECQVLIDECLKSQEQETLRSEADTLFNAGETYFNQDNCDMAKTKYEEALDLFKKLEDDTKVKECEERIISCENKLQTPAPTPGLRMTSALVAGLGVAAAAAIVLLIVVLLKCRTKPEPPKGE